MAPSRWTAACATPVGARYSPKILRSSPPHSPVVTPALAQAIEAAFLKAYRWQYVHSGAQHPQFGKVLSSLITEKQGQRIQAALATLQ